MGPVRIGVIGAGLIGRKHIEVLRSANPLYTLAGVADPSPAAKKEGDDLGYPVYPTLEEMLDKAKPDGVIVATPNQMHVANGLACIARNVPIIVEKPISDTIESAMKLVEAGEKAGVAIMTGHHRRHNPIMRRAIEIIQGGGIGRVVAANAVWLAYKPKGYHDLAWRREPGGGVVLINGIHDIDCLRQMCGDIETVQATTSNAVRGFAVEDTAGAVIRFKSGAIGTLIISDTAASPWNWECTSQENPFYPYQANDSYMVTGTLGALSVPTLHHRWYDADKQNWGLPMTERREPIQPADPYYEQMRNFAGVIRGTEKPVLDGRNGAKTLAATLAISISSQTGASVRVDDMLVAKA